MSYILGLDAGNSKTIALIADLEGSIVSYGRSSCGDISNPEVGPAKALSHVAAAVQEALDRVALHPAAIGAQGFSMAGADWPEDFSYLSAALRKYPWAKNALIVNDALGALRSASVSGVGVAVVCGTYAVTAARSAMGQSWHASFWQETGGAYQLAQAALRACYRAELGIDRPTSLTHAMLSYLHKADVTAVLHEMTARGSHVLESDVAKLAPLVLTEAAQGDEAANAIVEQQAAILADYVFAAARKVALAGAFTLYLTGGVFRHPSRLLERALQAQVQSTEPDIEVMRSQTEPIIGALLYAFEQAGVAPNGDLYERLSTTLPEAALFTT